MNPYELVIRRDRGLCVLCGLPYAHLHHIISRKVASITYRDDPRNLCLLCAGCHGPMANTKAVAAQIVQILAGRFPDYADWYNQNRDFAWRLDG